MINSLFSFINVFPIYAENVFSKENWRLLLVQVNIFDGKVFFSACTCMWIKPSQTLVFNKNYSRCCEVIMDVATENK